MWRRYGLIACLAAGALAPAAAAAQEAATQAVDCLVLPAEATIRRTLPVAPTEAGRQRLRDLRFVFLHVTFELSRENGRVSAAQEVPSVRQLVPPGMQTTFSFARTGVYALSVHHAPAEGWPHTNEIGTPVAGCRTQRLTVTPETRRDFDDTRVELWVGARLPNRIEAGGAIYFRRLGLAASADALPFSRGDPLNRWTARFDARWRGARGYIGAGVAFFPDDQPGRERFRPTVTAAQELPSFKAFPTWMLLELRQDEYRRDFYRGLRAGVGLRLDLLPDRRRDRR